MTMLTPDNTPYELIGGEAKVRELVDRFYDYMDDLDEVKEIRSMHANSLRVSRDKLFMFLSGWMGGPDLYQEKFGHPMLRRRHLPFSIGATERDQWMNCMNRALADTEMPQALRDHLSRALTQVADHMRNRAEHDNQLNIVGTAESGGADQ